MGVMNGKRKKASPSKLSWHVDNNTEGKLKAMIKMNFSYLNKDDLAAGMNNTDTIYDQ
jgi:hypothetical protein